MKHILVADDSNGLQDVFVVETTNGSVVRASVGATAPQGIGDIPIGQGERVSLSKDGKWVAFTTDPGNLVDPGSTNTSVALGGSENASCSSNFDCF